MMRFICLLTWMMSAAVVSAQDQQPDLPRGVAPNQGLASVRDGKLIVRTLVYFYAPKTVCDPKTNHCVTTYTQNASPVTRDYRIDQIRAYDVRGNRIAGKRLAKLLADETPVLVSSDNQPVDPLHLRVYRSDMIVLVLSAQSALNPPTLSPTPPTIETAPMPIITPTPVKPGEAVLRLSIIGTFQQFAGEECHYVLQVGNAGGARATGVTLFVEIPSKMSVPMVKLPENRRLMTRLADLQPGETRQETLVLTTPVTGEFNLVAEVVADGALKSSATRKLTVRETEKTKEPPK